MTLKIEQVATLLGLILSAKPDLLDCDGCFERMADFAEAELTNKEIPEAMQVVETHLHQCSCCGDEYQALLTGLQELDCQP